MTPRRRRRDPGARPPFFRTRRSGVAGTAAALALLLAAAAPGAGQEAGGGEDPATLRVMTYNIHAGLDADGERNLERVSRAISDAGADVVLVQEVDRGTQRSRGVDQLARLRELTGLRGVFGKSLDFQGGEYGIAVLSRWPIRGAVKVPLPVRPPPDRAGGSHEPRIALSAEIEAPGGPLRVVNTHLAAGDPAYRAQELVGVLRHIAGLSREVPVVFGGDLNALPGSAVARAPGVAFDDAFAACGEGPGETFPSDAPDRRIDYLLVRGPLRCAGARVPATRASDHRPVVAELERTR